MTPARTPFAHKGRVILCIGNWGSRSDLSHDDPFLYGPLYDDALLHWALNDTLPDNALSYDGALDYHPLSHRPLDDNPLPHDRALHHHPLSYGPIDNDALSYPRSVRVLSIGTLLNTDIGSAYRGRTECECHAGRGD
jgi:hypothetical protein